MHLMSHKLYQFFPKKCDLIGLANLTYLEIAAMYLAASIHDFEHP